MEKKFNAVSGTASADPILKWVEHFLNIGFACQWLHAKEKRPIGEGWQSKPIATLQELEASYRQGNNLGFRPGKWSRHQGKCVIVLDIDVKSDDPRYRTEALSVLGTLVGRDAPPAVITGGGGLHYYMLCPEGSLPDKARTVIAQSSETIVGSNRPAWAIEVLSTGSNCVTPPSIHPETGDYYKLSQESVGFIDMPEGVCLALLATAHQEKGRLPNGPANAVSQPEETPENIEKLKACLKAIPPCLSYSDWVRVLFSIKAHGWRCGEAIAREWSATCLEKFSEEAFAKAWNSDKGASHTGPVIGPGTVYHIGKEHSWLPSATSEEIEGDIANGREFARRFHGQYLHCFSKKKWLLWTGKRWKWCERGEEMEAAKQVADTLMLESAKVFKARDVEQAKRLQKRAHGLSNVKRLEAMLQLAASEDGMGIVNPAVLDKDAMLLAVKNGVLDLKTGALIQPVPEQYISRQAAAEYVAGAQCPQFLGFLSQAFGDDNNMLAYAQRICGYILTGLVDEEVMFFMYGLGANGKSVFANIVSGIMGDYAITVAPDMLNRKQSSANAPRNDILRLAGARLALANETGTSDVWDEQLVKALVSREKLSARPLYGQAFDFMPTHKLLVRGNHQPGIRDDSDGMWRRLHLIGFAHQIPENERINDLDRRILQTESDGVLAWMIQGCLHWQQDGLNPPESIRLATLAYRKDCDLIGEWLEEECITAPGAKTNQSLAYNNFRTWCERAGMHPTARKIFTRKIKERFPTQGYAQSRKAFCGFQLKEQGRWAPL